MVFVLVCNMFIRNIVYLSLVNITNYIIPLLLVPFSIKTLTLSGYGKFSFSLAIINYFILFIDFGIGLIATKKICETNSSSNKGTIIYSVIFIKGVLFLVSCFCLFLVVFFLDWDWKLYATLIPYLFGMGATFSWYFQAIENMKIYTTTIFISKIITIPLIFVFVRSIDDIYLYSLLYSLSVFIPVIYCIYYIFKNVKYKKIDILITMEILKESLPLFYSLISIRIYTVTNTVIIGLVLGDKAVGIFSSIERIYRALISLTTPIHTMLYPKLNKIKANRKLYSKYILQFMLFQFVLFSGCYLVSSLSFDYFSRYIFDGYGGDIKFDFILFGWILVIGPIGNTLGTLILIPNNMAKYQNKVILIASLCHIVYIYPFIKYVGITGGISGYLLTETIVFLGMLYYVINKTDILKKK